MEEIFFDCHVHTKRSACGEDITDSWLCAQAQQNNWQFAVTDHSMHLYYEPEIAWALLTDDNIRLFEQRRQAGRERILRYVEELRSCAAEHMRVGLEIDVLPDGQIMFPEDVRPLMDLLVGAVHYLPTIRNRQAQEIVEAEFRQQTLWLMAYGVDVLAHPFRILLGAGYEAQEELVRWTVEQAAVYGVALEINSHKPYPAQDILMTRLACEQGVRLAWGTDAHNTREFGQFAYHQQIMQQAGISRSQRQECLFKPDKVHSSP